MKFPISKNKEEFDEHFQSSIWLDAAKQICRRHQISFIQLKRPKNGEHVVFLIDDSFVIKIYRPFRGCFEREKKALEFVGGRTNFKIPEIVQIGEIEGFDYILMTQLSGAALTRAVWLTLPGNEQMAFVSELAAGLKTIHSLDAESFDCDWSEFVEERAKTFVERQVAHGVNPQIIESLPEFLETNLKLLPKNYSTVFLHGDVHFGNLRVSMRNDDLQISGFFDFADSLKGFHEYEFVAVGVLMMQGQGKVQREFFRAYDYKESEIDENLRVRLMLLTILYECSNLRKYALRLKPEAVDFTLGELERAIWAFAG